jgi:hypothetical protein
VVGGSYNRDEKLNYFCHMDLTCQHIASMHASMIAMSAKVVGHTTFSSRGVLHVSLSRTHGGFLKSSVLSYYS